MSQVTGGIFWIKKLRPSDYLGSHNRCLTGRDQNEAPASQARVSPGPGAVPLRGERAGRGERTESRERGEALLPSPRAAQLAGLPAS